MSPRRRRPIRIPRIRILRAVSSRPILMHARREAGEEDDERREEQQNHRREDSPHANGVVGVRSAAVLVDFVLDDSERDEVARHGHDRDYECDGRHEGREQGTAGAGAEREEEGDECEAAGDGVEDHDAR